MAVKGGNGEYIKKGCKSDMDTKRSINDRSDGGQVVCRLTITHQADHVLDQLAMVLDLPRGQVANVAILALALTYNGAARLLGTRPDLEELIDRLTAAGQ